MIYRQLYAESSQRIDLLNASASWFFLVLQELLQENVELTLAKLADPPGAGTRENATLKRLVAEIPTADRVLRQLVTSRIRAYESLCVPIQKRRNKLIAHYDLAQHTQVSPRLPAASREEIEKALRELRELMNCVAEYYGESPTAYEHFIDKQGGGESLVFCLKQGLRYEELVNQKKIPWNDLAEFRL